MEFSYVYAPCSSMMSMKEGVDTTSGVVCRTLKTGKVPSFLYIKHLYSVKEPTKLKYR